MKRSVEHPIVNKEKNESFTKEKKQEDDKIIEEKRRLLFKKKDRIFSSYYELANFKEPVIIMLRRTRKADFLEGIKTDTYEYEHSDGTLRKVYLNSKYLQMFPYGKREFACYVCHEDFPLPLPAEPEVTAETVGLVIDKTLNDIKAWKAKETLATAKLWKTVGMVVAGIFALYIVYKLVIVKDPTVVHDVVQTGSTTIQVVPANATVLP